jgi:hypothetical protein
MANEQTRLRLEMNLAEKGGVIGLLKPNAAWVNDPEWIAFQNAWGDLVSYYTDQGETVIGPITLREFADYVRLLRKALLSRELDAQRYEEVEEALMSLENTIDEIVREAMTNLRYDRPDLNI